MAAVSTDSIFARLTEIATEIERHATGIWLLEREREELRTQLRRTLNPPATVASEGVPHA